MKLKIENANTKLLNKLFEIEERCFDQEAFTKRQIAYLLTDYNTITLIAKVNSNISGFIMTHVEIKENTEFGHIITINVIPNCRRKGIAKKLIQEIENTLKQKGINECRLEVREDNNPAIKLYQTLGYQKISKIEKYYGKKHGLYLKKKL